MMESAIRRIEWARNRFAVFGTVFAVVVVLAPTNLFNFKNDLSARPAAYAVHCLALRMGEEPAHVCGAYARHPGYIVSSEAVPFFDFIGFNVIYVDASRRLMLARVRKLSVKNANGSD